MNATVVSFGAVRVLIGPVFCTQLPWLLLIDNQLPSVSIPPLLLRYATSEVITLNYISSLIQFRIFVYYWALFRAAITQTIIIARLRLLAF